MAFFRHSHLCEDEAATIALARDFSARLLPLGAVCVCLQGTLGMGKSVFARAAIRALSAGIGAAGADSGSDSGAQAQIDVPSPTFTLVQSYAIAGEKEREIWHFDLYRLESPDDVFDLSWEDALADHIMLVEWPERLGAYMPRNRIDVVIEAVDNVPKARRITITPHGTMTCLDPTNTDFDPDKGRL